METRPPQKKPYSGSENIQSSETKTSQAAGKDSVKTVPKPKYFFDSLLNFEKNVQSRTIRIIAKIYSYFAERTKRYLKSSLQYYALQQLNGCKMLLEEPSKENLKVVGEKLNEIEQLFCKKRNGFMNDDVAELYNLLIRKYCQLNTSKMK